jgi:hypothetical protein
MCQNISTLKWFLEYFQAVIDLVFRLQLFLQPDSAYSGPALTENPGARGGRLILYQGWNDQIFRTQNGPVNLHAQEISADAEVAMGVAASGDVQFCQYSAKHHLHG